MAEPPLGTINHRFLFICQHTIMLSYFPQSIFINKHFPEPLEKQLSLATRTKDDQESYQNPIEFISAYDYRTMIIKEHYSVGDMKNPKEKIVFYHNEMVILFIIQCTDFSTNSRKNLQWA